MIVFLYSAFSNSNLILIVCKKFKLKINYGFRTFFLWNEIRSAKLNNGLRKITPGFKPANKLFLIACFRMWSDLIEYLQLVNRNFRSF